MEKFKCHRVVIAFWVFLCVCVLDTMSHSLVEEKQTIPEKYRSLKHKGTIKTIVCPDDDDVIDCVNFYQQPAFDDPIIKSLKVEFNPFSDETEMTDDESYFYQTWRKYGECPNGTIPIKRTLYRDTSKKSLNNYGSGIIRKDHEYAVVTHDEDVYFGSRAKLNVWNPKVANDREYSLSQLWLVSDIDDVETIEAGWTVSHPSYRDSKTRLFVFWTTDDYRTKGCYDLQCPGFIQTDKDIVLGGALEGISSYMGKGYYMKVAIYKAKKKGNWWLNLNGKKVGYWPSIIFENLQDYALRVQWGGEIINKQSGGYHTTTQMGSGHFPYEARNRASYIANINVMNDKLQWVDVKNSDLQRGLTHPGCYNLTIRAPTEQLGTHFYFGGPGYSATSCK